MKLTANTSLRKNRSIGKIFYGNYSVSFFLLIIPCCINLQFEQQPQVHQGAQEAKLIWKQVRCWLNRSLHIDKDACEYEYNFNLASAVCYIIVFVQELLKLAWPLRKTPYSCAASLSVKIGSRNQWVSENYRWNHINVCVWLKLKPAGRQKDRRGGGVEHALPSLNKFNEPVHG